jgi:predicted phage-related endonuclease
MTIETFPQTSLGGAAAAVVDRLPRPWPVPDGVETFDASNRENWLKMRESDVTASAIACLLGIHDYLTPYQYWARKSGIIEEEIEHSAVLERGNDLEPIVLKHVGRKRPEWKVWTPGLYYRDPAARIGATPDALAICPEKGRGVIQVKTTVDMIFRDKWVGEDKEVLPPLWICAQTILEAHLTGAEWAAVAVMVLSGYGAGLDVHIIEVPINRKLVARMYEAVADFWRRVAEKDAPDPDYGRDARAIASLYADDDGSEADLSGNERIVEILAERASLKDIESAGSAAEKKRKALDAEIIQLLQNAARGRLADGTVIEAKTVHRNGFTVEPSQFRTVKVKAKGSR